MLIVDIRRWGGGGARKNKKKKSRQILDFQRSASLIKAGASYRHSVSVFIDRLC